MTETYVADYERGRARLMEANGGYDITAQHDACGVGLVCAIDGQPRREVVELAIRALKAGASGYLTKQSAPAQLVTAIRQVKQGRKYVSTTLAEQLAARLGEDMDAAPHELLSNREYQTLTLLSSGKTLSEVAGELKLSVKTVSVYRARLLEKLQLKNNAELTHYAIKNGLVE